jgi:hypothetical protein
MGTVVFVVGVAALALLVGGYVAYQVHTASGHINHVDATKADFKSLARAIDAAAKTIKKIQPTIRNAAMIFLKEQLYWAKERFLMAL